MSGIVLLSCSSFIFWYFWFFSVRKTTFLYYCPNLVSKYLSCCLKTKTSLPDLNNSFSKSFLCSVVPKIAVWCKLVSSQAHTLCLCHWFVRFLKSSFAYLNKEQPTFAGWRLGLPYCLSREHLPIMITRPVAWAPRLVVFWLKIFIRCGILWLYLTYVLFKFARLTQIWPGFFQRVIKK